mmetsp:Transcript_59942/g.99493  ORF Transcript_59942/g.99493 Transcript_59942/m.99493 type:complete len:88 (+) Transcript_59942:212-475(+)
MCQYQACWSKVPDDMLALHVHRRVKVYRIRNHFNCMCGEIALQANQKELNDVVEKVVQSHELNLNVEEAHAYVHKDPCHYTSNTRKA